ncbi:MAG TPA: tryptophan 2,3-dioxygenase family protein, partial [Bradyrhizobium sp.]|nr:tryptophan 2,3-dioxygenase family protein [Bradyrhizobium sp.]
MRDNIIDSSKGVNAMSQRKEISYSGYLELDKILQAQQPLSSAHDEMLFIIQHQTSELWMKLAIHELSATCQLIAANDLQPAFKTLSRVSRILEQLNSAWDVLRTMTPSEYTEFRGSLGQSSGFQSWQYRMIEFLVGNKNAAMIHAHQDDKAVVERLEVAHRAPSIYDLTIQLLDRRGLAIDKAIIERDVSVSHIGDDSVVRAWLSVYRDPARFWELYELAEKLVDFEDYFRRWRFNHVTTVERIIGF